MVPGKTTPRHPASPAILVPIAFTTLRLLIGPIMVLVACTLGDGARVWLAAMLCIGMGSDFADGISARALGVQSVALRRFDSRTDIVFWSCALGCVWALSPALMRALGWLVAALVILHLAATVIDRLRSGNSLAVRSYLAKAMGILVFAAVLQLLWTGRAGALVWLAAIWVLAAEIDVILIAMLLPRSEQNIGSAWGAWKRRRDPAALPRDNPGR